MTDPQQVRKAALLAKLDQLGAALHHRDTNAVREALRAIRDTDPEALEMMRTLAKFDHLE